MIRRSLCLFGAPVIHFNLKGEPFPKEICDQLSLEAEAKGYSSSKWATPQLLKTQGLDVASVGTAASAKGLFRGIKWELFNVDLFPLATYTPKTIRGYPFRTDTKLFRGAALKHGFKSEMWVGLKRAKEQGANLRDGEKGKSVATEMGSFYNLESFDNTEEMLRLAATPFTQFYSMYRPYAQSVCVDMSNFLSDNGCDTAGLIFATAGQYKKIGVELLPEAIPYPFFVAHTGSVIDMYNNVFTTDSAKAEAEAKRNWKAARKKTTNDTSNTPTEAEADPAS